MPTIAYNPATPTFDGLMPSSDKAKLNGIAAGATTNATDAQLRDRATHTGTQAVATITGLAASATTDTTNATNIASGTLATARLDTGTAAGKVVTQGSAINATTVTASNLNLTSTTPGSFAFVMQAANASDSVFVGKNSSGVTNVNIQAGGSATFTGTVTLGAANIGAGSGGDSGAAVTISGSNYGQVLAAYGRFRAGDGSVVPLNVRAASSGQAANLTEWGNNAGTTVLASVGPTGAIASSVSVRTGRYTVATLPTPGANGRVAYATNGRKSTELVGAGTGVPAWDDGTAWRTFDGSTVQA